MGRLDRRRVLRGCKLTWDLTVAPAPRLSAALLGLSLFNAALVPLGALFIARLTDAAVRHDALGATIWGVVLAASASVAKYAVQTGYMIGSPFTHPGTVRGDQVLSGLVASLPTLEHLERPEYLDRITALRQERYFLLNTYTALTNAGGAVLQMALTIGLLVSVHPAMLGLVALGIPQFWLARRSDRIVKATIERSAPDIRLSQHFVDLMTKAPSGRELRVFGAMQALIERDTAVSRHLTSREVLGALKAQAVAGLGALLLGMGYIGAVVLAVAELVAGHGSPGAVMLTIMLASQVARTLAVAASTTNALMASVRVVGRYLWFMDYLDAYHGRRTQRVAGGDHATIPDRLRDGITLDGVHFTYPGRTAPALAGISVHLPAGSTVALVGANGAGKTTLVKLLSGMYEPDGGSITVDGTPLSAFDINEWRNNLTAAFQDFARFELLVRETVGIGDLPWDDSPIDDHIGEALERSSARGWVSDLPDGVRTQLGVGWPGGVDLSGGQWQTLAIARSEMRTRPLLLLLDEPTSALDAFAEAGVFERYASAARRSAADRGGIALLVSHRLSTVRSADLILVIDGGRVVEQGSHDELIRAGGWYATSFSLQARGYQ